MKPRFHAAALALAFCLAGAAEAAAPAIAPVRTEVGEKTMPAGDKVCMVNFGAIEPGQGGAPDAALIGSVNLIRQPGKPAMTAVKLGRFGLTDQQTPLAAPTRALLRKDAGDNHADFGGAPQSTTTGFRLFAFRTGPDTVQAVSRDKLEVVYAVEGAERVVVVDLAVAELDAQGKPTLDTTAPQRWRDCLSRLLAD